MNPLPPSHTVGHVAVDFETYYDKECTVKTLGPVRYAEHPDCHAYMVGVFGRLKGGEPISWVGDPAEFDWKKIEGCVWLAHNSQFDAAVFDANWENWVNARHLSPTWIDTAALSVYFQGGRALADASVTWFGEKMDKEIRNRMSGRHFADLTPEAQQSMRDYCLRDCERTFQLWEKLGHLWPDFERRLAMHTAERGNQGVRIDTDMLEENIRKIEEERGKVVAGIPWSGAPLSPIKLRNYCADQGVPPPKSTAKDSEEFEQWCDKYGERLPFVATFRQLRGLNFLAELHQKIKARTRGGIMPFSTKYFAAQSTGRWGGDSGVNLLNLRKTELAGADVRKLFVPDIGHKFLIYDFSQVEPRVLHWLIGDKEFLDKVRSGQDIYEIHARATLGYDDPRPLKEVSIPMRQMAKARELGLGYGCGAVKFRGYAKTEHNVILTEEQADTQVRQFRDTNPLITAFWKQMNDALQEAAGGKDHILDVALPSGRNMRYRQLRFTKGKWPDGSPKMDVKGYASFPGVDERWWGSKLVENIVQATARDVCAAKILDLLDAGIDVLWNVHDEIIMQVLEEEVEEKMATVEEIMTRPLPWLEGLPIAVEGGVHDYYEK